MCHSKLFEGILWFFILDYERWDSHRGFNHSTLSIYKSTREFNITVKRSGRIRGERLSSEQVLVQGQILGEQRVHTTLKGAARGCASLWLGGSYLAMSTSKSEMHGAEHMSTTELFSIILERFKV